MRNLLFERRQLLVSRHKYTVDHVTHLLPSITVARIFITFQTPLLVRLPAYVLVMVFLVRRMRLQKRQ